MSFVGHQYSVSLGRKQVAPSGVEWDNYHHLMDPGAGSRISLLVSMQINIDERHLVPSGRTFLISVHLIGQLIFVYVI